jgi:hypothetical protein
VPLRYKNIAAAANEILAAVYGPGESPITVGERWPKKWAKQTFRIHNTEREINRD